jgi:hypothetical protein
MMFFSKASISYPALPATAAIVGGFAVRREAPYLKENDAAQCWQRRSGADRRLAVRSRSDWSRSSRTSSYSPASRTARRHWSQWWPS